MIRQWLQKRHRIVGAVLNTYVRKRGQIYDDSEWWDSCFYTSGISDSATVAAEQNVLSAKYHYASMEMLILRHLRNHEVLAPGFTAVDFGSGAGHWIDFYLALGAATVDGLDVSTAAIEHLSAKYSETPGVMLHHGKAIELLPTLGSNYDLINAIGIMFHIVDDTEWRQTIANVSRALRTGGGVFVAGGHFGIFNGLNAQIDRSGNINKRLRSRREWMRTLADVGFQRFHFYRNDAYLFINDDLPENNILVAIK